MTIRWSFFAESAMTAALEAEVRQLLVRVFPLHAHFFSLHSYRGSIPEYRLVGRLLSGQLVAHLAGGPREIAVNDQSVSVFGIGAVAVHPELHGQGVGREMFLRLKECIREKALADFGFLECREEVAGFYQKAGFDRLAQHCTSLHHETREWETYRGPVMAMPVRKSLDDWPKEGEIHLRGHDW